MDLPHQQKVNRSRVEQRVERIVVILRQHSQEIDRLPSGSLVIDFKGDSIIVKLTRSLAS